MRNEEETSALLTRIHDARMERQNDAEDQRGNLLNAADVFICHNQNWMKQINETAPPVCKTLADPKLSRSHSILVLSNSASQDLVTLAESYRAGIFRLSGWIERKMLEARTNAGFIAYELTGLAGQRWLLYSLLKFDKMAGDEESQRGLFSELKNIPPDERPWKQNRWAKTINQDGKSKVLSDLPSLSDYVEKIWPVPIGLPDQLRQIRQRNHEDELNMIRMANWLVHPTVAGDSTDANPITALYIAVQMVWDILQALSETNGLSLTTDMKNAHNRFADTMISVLRQGNHKRA